MPSEPANVLTAQPHDRVDPTTRTRARPHFPALEGLRAVAATLVVFTHAGSLAGDSRSGFLAQPAKMMDIGVAIFFVLSGFLIYRPFADANLNGEKPMPTRAFWWRRALRILPAYWLALSVFWFLYAVHPFGFRAGFTLGTDWWKYYLLLQIYDANTTLGGIVQAWSIATEVTFYLMIPFWVMAIRALRFKRKRTSLGVEIGGALVLVAIGYLSRWWFSHSNTLWIHPHGTQGAVTMRAVAFSWLPNQIDLFALGMIVAIVHVWATRTDRIGRLDQVLGKLPTLWWVAAAGLFCVVAYVLGPPAFAVGYKSGYWQERQILYGAVAVAMLIPLAFGNQSVGGVRRFLQWKPVWWVGVVSYGFYLWHLDWMNRVVNRPTVFATHPGWHGWAGTGSGNTNFWELVFVGVAAGLICAAISWYAMEKPLLRLKGLIGGRRALKPSEAPEPVGVG